MPKKKIERKVYHVVCRMERFGGKDVKPRSKILGWEVKSAGAKRAAAVLPMKSKAIARAKELAKKAPLGQVIIHGKDGKIQREFTYGKDPKHIPG
jgi:hypothetical protein